MMYLVRRWAVSRLRRGRLPRWGTYLLFPPSVRFRVESRLLGDDPRRWILYGLVGSAWRQYRKLGAGTPELIYRATLGPDARLAMATSKPLPRRLRTRAVRRALEAAARADLA